MMKPPRGPIAIVLLAVAAALLMGGSLWLAFSHRPPADKGQAAIGGPFRLIDQDGKPTTEEVLRGQWTAVFFGYTYCPDICPMTMQALAQARRELGPKGEALRLVLVSVDPARDTPAQLKQWVEAQGLPANTLALTGTKTEIDATVKAYKAYYQIQPPKPGAEGQYLVDHISTVYLMDPKGRFSKPLSASLPPDKLAGLIGSAMGGA